MPTVSLATRASLGRTVNTAMSSAAPRKTDKRMKTCVAAYPSIESPRLANQELDAVALSAQIECPVQIVQPGTDHVSSVETYTTLNGTLTSDMSMAGMMRVTTRSKLSLKRAN